MPIHVVKQGETLPSIAAQYGGRPWRAIYEDSDNAELRQKRPDPNVLMPGDRISIRDPDRKEESGATDNRHRFELKREPHWLCIVLEDLNGEPFAHTAYSLEVAHQKWEGETDGDGLLEHRIPPEADSGRLSVMGKDGKVERVLVLKIGHLDPLEESSGHVARLNNLGYRPGAVDSEEGVEGIARSLAIEEFQCDSKSLSADGLVGPKTRAEMKKTHGC